MATPVDWKDGEDVIIVPAVSDEEAKERFPERVGGQEALPPRHQAAGLTAGTPTHSSAPAATGDKPGAAGAVASARPLSCGA